VSDAWTAVGSRKHAHTNTHTYTHTYTHVYTRIHLGKKY